MVRDPRVVEHVAHAESAKERGALGDVADIGESRRIAARIEPTDGDGSLARLEQADLPAPFGPAMPTIEGSGMLTAQSRSAHAPR